MPYPDCWYTVIDEASAVLRQGDILRGVTLFAPAPDCDRVYQKTGKGVATATEGDWIILNNSCDLQNIRRTPFVLTAAVAPLKTRLERFNDGERLHIAEAWRRRMVRDPFILAPHKGTDFPQSVVNLREVVASPREMILRWAEQTAPRLRLNSPFREALAAAIAEHVGSVGIEDSEGVPRFVESFYPGEQIRIVDLFEGVEGEEPPRR